MKGRSDPDQCGWWLEGRHERCPRQESNPCTCACRGRRLRDPRPEPTAGELALADFEVDVMLRWAGA